MTGKKHILVTGGAGFIGSHMVERLLKDGHTVTVLDNLSTGSVDYLPKEVTFIKGDTANAEDVEKAFKEPVDAVFHIAGCASTINSFTDPFSDVRANFHGGINVAMKCVEHKVPRLLYASSMTAYGFVESLPVKETQPTVPVSYYGITKYASERFIHATGLRKDIDTKLNVTSFRMFNVYGPRQSLTNPYQGVMAIFIGNVLRNEPITLFGDGQQSRDFVFIDDVVNAWVGSLENEKTFGEVYNIGFGQDRSMNDLIATILTTVGKDPTTYPINHKPERPGDQRHMRADITKMNQATGWEPKYNLQKGLEKTLEWAKAVQGK